MIQEYIFVWNAKSGKINLCIDILHKILSPRTYPCHLCAITHDIFSAKSIWKKFQGDFPVPIRFLHLDEWTASNKEIYEWPAILAKRGEETKVLLQRQEINKMNLEDVIEFLWRDSRQFKEVHPYPSQ